MLIAAAALGCVEKPDVAIPAREVELEVVAVLGSADDSISISSFAHVTETAAGDYFVVGVPFPRDRILRYSPTGALLGTIGRPGDGPGEFRSIVSLSRTADSVVVFELTGNVSSISSELSVNRVATLPGLVQRGWSSPRGVGGPSCTPEPLPYRRGGGRGGSSAGACSHSE